MSQKKYSLNRSIEAFVLEKERAGRPYTEEELAYVNQYIGYGGMWQQSAELQKERGLYEYYTPVSLVEKMVGLAHKYGFRQGKILEPSCGIGRFLHYFSPESELTAIELDKTSYLIARANFPRFTILHQSFNELFVDRRGRSIPFEADYQLVIGNPPYGAFAGRHTAHEKSITKADTYVDYFITRGLDLLQARGLLIYIIPSAFLDGAETPVKSAILQKARLLDAYRLPKAVFEQTDIQTDIVVFQKK